MWRYIKGDHIELPGDAVGSKERERGIELSYVIQSGTFKDVAFRVRQADYDSDFARNVGELRVNVDYSVQLW
ncbi:outer membrane porin, OprD family [compost metagenome]